MPSLDSFLPIESPGVPFATTNEAWPRWPRSLSTVATTTVTSAIPPFVMKTLVPFRTHSSSSSSAVVRSDRTSEPALGSVTAYAPSLISSPSPKHSGTQRPICSGVPGSAMPAAASEPPEIARAIPAQPQWSSSA